MFPLFFLSLISFTMTSHAVLLLWNMPSFMCSCHLPILRLQSRWPLTFTLQRLQKNHNPTFISTRPQLGLFVGKSTYDLKKPSWHPAGTFSTLSCHDYRHMWCIDLFAFWIVEDRKWGCDWFLWGEWLGSCNYDLSCCGDWWNYNSSCGGDWRHCDLSCCRGRDWPCRNWIIGTRSSRSRNSSSRNRSVGAGISVSRNGRVKYALWREQN